MSRTSRFVQSQTQQGRRFVAGVLIAVLFAVGLPSWQPSVQAQVSDDAWPPAPQVAPGNACSARIIGSNRTFDVGPGREHSELTTVPWLSLEAGDVVNIFHRAEPYRTKVGIRAQGTQEAPVIINGVTDASCERPTVSGEDAITTDDAIETQFYNIEFTEFLGTFFLYRASSDPFGYRPKHITIQNLTITGASQENTYTGQDGETRRYDNGAAGVFAIVVEDLTLENNEITGNGNGVFVNSKDEFDTSHRIIIRNNRIFDNGNPGRDREHNLYIQARRSLYEGNYIGQLVVGAQGSSLKDRSSGTVVRFNHIDAAARALDLVEIEGGVQPVKGDPLYSVAWVYGNLIVTDHSRPALSSSLLIHWGGDNSPEHFRDGTLYFYNNTVVIDSSREQYYWFAIFDMNNNDQSVVAHSNVFANMQDAFMYLGRARGTIELQGTNWLTTGWGEAGGWQEEVTLIQSGSVIEGADPLFTELFHPAVGSPLVDGVTSVDVVAPFPAIAANLTPSAQFLPPGGSLQRPVQGSAPDLGGFETMGTALSSPNCDGRFNVTDALLVAQYSVGLRSESTCPLSDPSTQIGPGGDVNGDGNINVTDALLIARCSVGHNNIFCPAQ